MTNEIPENNAEQSPVAAEPVKKQDEDSTLETPMLSEVKRKPQRVPKTLVEGKEIKSVKEVKAGKDKKYNGFLRNSHRKLKDKPTDSPIIENTSDKSIPHNESSGVKEDIFSPEYLLFGHLRQKTGSSPSKFWENLHIVLKEKAFPEIKRSDMSLISYSALYESVEIFETLLYDYGHLLPQKEIETSIFKLATNKNPLILHHTINFYSKAYTPSEEFISDLITDAAKGSYREEANILLVHWLAPKMTEKNKEVFWNSCLENKNISFMTVALNNLELNHFLKNNYDNFKELVVKTGREHTINTSLNKKLTTTPTISEPEKTDRKVISADIHDITEAKEPAKVKTWLGNNSEKLQSLQQAEQPQCMPEITFKKKRKVM